MSRLFGRLSRVRRPRAFARLSIRVFHGLFPRIDLAEAERSSRTDYASLQDFFTRSIRPEVRPLDPSPLVCSCDGAFGQAGAIESGTVLQAKGVPYAVAEFLQDPELAARLEGGAFCTIYLAPWNYHRVHHAISGEIVQARHMAGDLWPVNREAVEKVPGLFVRNERASVVLRTARGTCVAVMVGATNVGSILLRCAPDLGRGTTGAWAPDRPLAVEKGDELGVFELGSTVVLLVDRELRSALGGDDWPQVGLETRMGRALPLRR
jgi:phosphatidylserine decarboxylase